MSNRGCVVLFDLDGTLVDSAPDLVAALEAMRAQLGLSPLPARDWSHQVAQGGQALVAKALEDTDGVDQQAALALFLAHYQSHPFEHSKVYVGMVDLLDRLHQAQRPLGVVTNKRQALADLVLAQAHLARYFDVVIGGDATAHPKPNPEPVIAACQRLQASPSQAVLIGDDRRDIEAANRAGAGGIIAGWGYGSSLIPSPMRESTPWCENPSELWGWLCEGPG